MLMIEERKQVVEYGKKLITEGLTTGTGGNISVLDKDRQYMAISPSGIDYFKTELEDVVIMDLQGNIIEGDRTPSSEYVMHIEIYNNFPLAKSVVHCHSTYATALSANHMDLPASNYIIAAAGGKDVRCSRYENFGTPEVAQAVVEAMEDRFACLIGNHGQITYGVDIKKAFNLAKNIETLSKIHVLALSCGTPVIIPDEKIEETKDKFETYGQ